MNDNHGRFVLFDYYTKKNILFKGKFDRAKYDIIWFAISESRKMHAISVPILGFDGTEVSYVKTDESLKNIKEIERLSRENIEGLIPDEVKSEALIDSIIDEAFNSSVIEGAFSTRKRVGEMIKNNEDPVNKSEKMILNNFRGLMFTLDNIDREINHDFVHEIWSILTKGTIDEDDVREGYRDGPVYVSDKHSAPIHEGAEHSTVEKLMDDLYDYINHDINDNPIIKACIMHYYFVYVHPYFDGNGRTARALMNLFLIKSGYEFFKYFSISKILPEKRSKYYETIKICEDYNNDVTYFVDFYTDLLLKTNVQIRKSYLKMFEKRIVEEYIQLLSIELNPRLRKFLNYMYKVDRKVIDVDTYTKKYQVVQETARKDLQYLVDINVLRKTKVRKKFVYMMNDLNTLIKKTKELKDS